MNAQIQAPGLFEPFAKAQEGLPTLGDLVWWSIPARVEIPGPDLEARLTEAGLPRKLVPRVQARGALSLALRSLETGNLIRRVTEDSEKTVFALVAEQVDRVGLQLGYEQVQTVVWRKAGRELEFSNGVHAEEIKSLFERYRRTVTATHLRNMVRHALEQTDPATVRAGLLFVPATHRDTLRAVAQLVASLDAGASLGILGVVDSKETRATMLRVVREELEGEVEAAQAELESLMKQEDVRPAALARRLESFRRIRAKVTGYAELLALSSRDLLERIRRLEDQIKRAI